MPKGGARSRSGPAPDPDALRRDRAGGNAGWVVLPVEGRRDPAPAWPLSLIEDRERQLWDQVWSTPQAIKWEENKQEIEVALYVRSLVAAERPDATAASRVLILRQQDYLGLSMPALARNKWRIGTVEDAARPTPAPRPTAKKGTKAADASVRNRLQVLNGGK